MRKRKRPLRVFEAFAGIGAQSVALRRANIDYVNVGISEWFVNALLAYDAINNASVPPHVGNCHRTKSR